MEELLTGMTQIADEIAGAPGHVVVADVRWHGKIVASKSEDSSMTKVRPRSQREARGRQLGCPAETVPRRCRPRLTLASSGRETEKIAPPHRSSAAHPGAGSCDFN